MKRIACGADKSGSRGAVCVTGRKPTLREMVVKTAMVVVMIYFLFWALALGAIGYKIISAEPIVVVEGDKQPLEAVMVAPGDTLWGLAKEFYPDQHTGKVVEAIRELNPGIDPGKLQVGQWIKLPKEVK